MARYGTADGRPRLCCSSIRPRCEHDTRPPSRAAGADRGDRAGAGRARLARVRARAVAGGRAVSARDRPPRGATSRRSSERARPAAVTSTPTRWSARARSRRRCTRAGGAVRMVDLLLDGSAPCGFSAHRPPGHHALPARAMGFCLFNNIARRGAACASMPRGVERVMIVDWDVHHGNGTNDIFHDDRPGAVRLDPPVAAVSGDRAGVGRRIGRGRGLHRQPARCRPGSDDGCICSLVDHVAVPLARVVRAAAGADLGRLRRPPRRSAGDVRGDRGRVRGDDRGRCGRPAATLGIPSGACSRAATR